MANSEVKLNDSRRIDAQLVDSIVREVLARLTAVQPAAAKPSAAPRAVGSQQPLGQLLLTPSVISVATLADRLTGVAQVVVGRRAVVTPAARDLLKQHKITISRSAEAAGGNKPALAIAVSDTAADAASLVRLMAPLASNIERLAKTGLTTVVTELTETVVKDGRLGLLLCGKPEAACCLANRRPGVRAAVARDRDEVAQAVANLGVNLLIVDPARRSLFQLGQMAKQFLATGAAKCPPALETQLG